MYKITFSTNVCVFISGLVKNWKENIEKVPTFYVNSLTCFYYNKKKVIIRKMSYCLQTGYLLI